MRKTLKTIGTVLVCGLMITACGGGSKSNLPSDGLFGNLPALNADWQQYKEGTMAEAKEKQKSLTSESEMKDYMAWAEKMEKESKEKEAAFDENVNAEWEKLNGTEAAFTVNDAFKAEIPVEIKSMTFNADCECIKLSAVAKEDFVVSEQNKAVEYLPFNYLDKSGNIIKTGDYSYEYRLSGRNPNGTLATTNYKAGEVIEREIKPNLYRTSLEELANYAQAASIQFTVSAQQQ